MVNCKATNPGESYEFLHSGNLKFSKILELKKECLIHIIVEHANWGFDPPYLFYSIPTLKRPFYLTLYRRSISLLTHPL